jgi:hypothetical protein
LTQFLQVMYFLFLIDHSIEIVLIEIKEQIHSTLVPNRFSHH